MKPWKIVVFPTLITLLIGYCLYVLGVEEAA